MSLRGGGVGLVALAVMALAVPASAADRLSAYKVNARSAKQLLELKRRGFDITEGYRGGSIEIVATRAQIRSLSKTGMRATLLRNARGQAASRPPLPRPPTAGRSGGRMRVRMWSCRTRPATRP